MQDPQDTKKESCSASSECAAVKARLDDCTARISGNGSTDETCEEELFDFLHCVDACVSMQIRVDVLLKWKAQTYLHAILAKQVIFTPGTCILMFPPCT